MVEVQGFNKIEITFNLKLSAASNKIEIPLMLARGYPKLKVIELFSKLEEEGYGEFFRGTQGRGNVGCFTPNEKCPEEYTMTFILKNKGRPKKILEDK